MPYLQNALNRSVNAITPNEDFNLPGEIEVSIQGQQDISTQTQANAL